MSVIPLLELSREASTTERFVDVLERGEDPCEQLLERKGGETPR